MQLVITAKGTLLLSIVFSCLHSGVMGWSNSSSTDNSKLKKDLNDIDACVIKAVFSNLYEESFLPTSINGFKQKNCKNQAEGFTCLKEKTKKLPAVLRRGIQTLVVARQKHHKKYCGAKENSEQLRNFISATKCIMDKKFPIYRSIDIEFSNSLNAIRERNYNNSATELKYLCCTVINYRKKFVDKVDPECPNSKSYMDELINSIIPNDLNLLCDEEEKYIKSICPSLEKIQVSDKFNNKAGSSPSISALYLIATLGEPDSR